VLFLDGDARQVRCQNRTMLEICANDTAAMFVHVKDNAVEDSE
jgi:hypothetical protein